MPKIAVDTVKCVLQRNEPDIRKVAEIMKELEMELRAEEEERNANRQPPVKKQFVVVLSNFSEDFGLYAKIKKDEDGRAYEQAAYEPITLADLDITGWVVQIPEEDSPATTPERIIRAAHEFNTTPKGRRLPVQTVGEACEAVSAKLLKEQGVWVKTKTPVLAVSVENRIPSEVVE